MDTNVRVAKHRIENALKSEKPASLNNLQILKSANIDIKFYIEESKKIYDSIYNEVIPTCNDTKKVQENKI